MLKIGFNKDGPKSSQLNNKFKLGFLGAIVLLSASTIAQAILPIIHAPIVPPTTLKNKSVPQPSNLSDFVANKSEAIALGKALFWEMRVGSDGKQACASCHYSAGADARIKNQLGPAANRLGFDQRRPNETLNPHDFPFTKFSDPSNRNSALVRDVRDVAGAQGVIKTQLISVSPNVAADNRVVVADNKFNVNGINTRQVTGRNSPTVINAVFNLRNFWDGRAQTIFNGVNPFGKRDPSAGVYKSVNGVPTFTKITLNDSSLASQVSGPPLNDVEMSALPRKFAQLGRKMLSMRALADQQVASDDSVLASYRHSSGLGLTKTYADMTKVAFKPEWWSSTGQVTFGSDKFSQMEANYSLIFSLAIQMYESTLVSDQTPFDKYDEGNKSALTAEQKLGFSVFMSKGKCVNCHGGPLFTNAAIRRDNTLGNTERLSRMVMGNGETAVYDEGFYNIGVTRTEDDLGVGGKDPFGNPLSFSRLAQKGLSEFYWKELDFPNVNVTPTERVAVDGSFKTPTLRNIALTAPYDHNGSISTLADVVEFYNRGGNFAKNNILNLDADIEPLGLSTAEKKALVVFMESLTDPRVAKHAAPFDHPELIVAHGHTGDKNSVINDGTGAAKDDALVVPAVGRNGYSNNEVKTFSQNLNAAPAPVASALVKCATENGTCVIPAGKTASVYYGASLNIYSSKTSVTGSISCNNATFGDPQFGVVKACYYMF